MELSNVTLEIFTKLEHQWLSHYESSKKTRVLSIDGGGTTAIVVGKALVHLEDQIRVQTGDPHARIADFFDLVAGTGRSLYSVEEVVKAVAEKNGKMFSFRSKRVFRRGRRCSGESMEKALTELLAREDGKALTLKDTCKPLLVPCYDLKSSTPFVFSRADALESSSFDFELRQVCRATSKTPGLFKPYDPRSVDGKTTYLAVDGGLVMNNPTAAAVTHTLNNKRDFPPVNIVEDLLVLSLGNGQLRSYGGGAQSESWVQKHGETVPIVGETIPTVGETVSSFFFCRGNLVLSAFYFVGLVGLVLGF